MSVLSDEERAKGLIPSPVDAIIERVKTLAAENAALRAENEALRARLREQQGDDAGQ